MNDEPLSWTVAMDSRIEHEKEHGRRIAGHAEAVWNWASPAGQRRADRRAAYLVSTGNIRSSDKALEIGCGTGLFTGKVYAATGARIVAADISEELLVQARRKLSGIELVCEDAMNLSFRDGSFDVVYGSSVLHHLDLLRSYKEIFRVLKPGGRMVFAEPNMLNPQIFIQKNIPFIKRWLGDSPDETAIERWRAEKTLKTVGFINVHIFPYDFLHPATPRPMIPLVESMGKIVEKIPLLREIAGSVIIYAQRP